MPIYEYHCPACNAVFEELIRSESAARRVACPQCGQTGVKRRMSTFATRVAPDRLAPSAGPCGSCRGPDGSCPLGK